MPECRAGGTHEQDLHDSAGRTTSGDSWTVGRSPARGTLKNQRGRNRGDWALRLCEPAWAATAGVQGLRGHLKEIGDVTPRRQLQGSGTPLQAPARWVGKGCLLVRVLRPIPLGRI